MKENIILYGATGYSGSLIAREAKKSGLKLILAGRNEKKLQILSKETGFPCKTFGFDNSDIIKENLKETQCVVNVAGPFIDNLPQFVQCCIQTKTDFIDLAMDPDVLNKFDKQARENGVMLLSCIGHAFLPIDCLGGYLYEMMPDAKKLTCYVSGMDTLSRGTAKSNIALIKKGIYHIRNGKAYKIRSMKPVKTIINGLNKPFIPSSFGVATLAYSTRIPSIECYFEATSTIKPFIFVIKYLSWLAGMPQVQRFIEKRIDTLPPGPSKEQLETGHVHYKITITNNSKLITAEMTTPEAYKTTYITTLESLARLKSHGKPGFQTPYTVFGHNILNDLPGFTFSVTRSKLKII